MKQLGSCDIDGQPEAELTESERIKSLESVALGKESFDFAYATLRTRDNIQDGISTRTTRHDCLSGQCRTS